MMVLITGAELFTGNMLVIVSCLEGRSKWRDALRNWFFVYAGNFLGSMLIALLIHFSGQFNFSDGLLGGFTIKVAANKVGLSFSNAFFMGVLCNWLVCMAVWMAQASKDITGKLLAVFFPIWLFITSGFEHSVANMYYIPAGIFAKTNHVWLDAAIGMGVTPKRFMPKLAILPLEQPDTGYSWEYYRRNSFCWFHILALIPVQKEGKIRSGGE